MEHQMPMAVPWEDLGEAMTAKSPGGPGDPV